MFKKTFVILAMIGLMLPSFVFAQSGDFGLDQAVEGTALKDFKAKNTDIPSLIGTIVGVVLSFVGAIFFLLILYAGFLWMTAFGSSEKVDKAKDIVQHAAVGLIIVLAAYAISTFVFSALTGATNSGSGSTNSTAHIPNTKCVPNGDNNLVWSNDGSTCITKCEYIYPSGTCQNKSNTCSKPYVPNICPGSDSNFQCCPPGGSQINI